MKRIIALIILLCLLLPAPPMAFADTSFWGNPEAIEQAAESVVMLSCYNSAGNLIATGSGFAALDTGIIVTNYHVVDGDVTAVQAHTEAGLYFDINGILCYDDVSDIAILKTNARVGLDLLETSDSSSLLKGSRVIAIGSPQGFMNTVSEGVYSGIYILDTDYLLFSASISAGSSGGALFNEDGKVVGITSATWTEGQNLNLAVPIEKVEALWESYLSGTYIEPVHYEPLPDYVSPSDLVLNLYSWASYFSDGSDGSFDSLQGFVDWFEKKYGEHVEINYDTYDSNEEMYKNIANRAADYDIVIPTDYMVASMISQNMLLPVNFSVIPNYINIDQSFRGLYYDPDNRYSVPYLYGVVGIIFNANVVDEADAVGWGLMWNSKYAGNILQSSNSREAFATAQYKLGLDVNSNDLVNWRTALAELKKQKPLIKSYEMSDVFSLMARGKAAICTYYGGDYFAMLNSQVNGVDLKIYYPERTNCFVDAMCIPVTCHNRWLANLFINYMLSAEPAIANAEYNFYPSPNSAVYTNQQYIQSMGEETIEVLYPDLGMFNTYFNKNAYRSLDSETLSYIQKLWSSLVN